MALRNIICIYKEKNYKNIKLSQEIVFAYKNKKEPYKDHSPNLSSLSSFCNC